MRVTYEIWNLETGNMVAALDSEGAAYAEVRSVVETGRVDPGFLGMVIADDAGHVVGTQEGEDLISSAHSGAAA
jgi:hypothetical protein